MTNQTPHIRRRIDRHRRYSTATAIRLFAFAANTRCDIMRGATATIWALFAGAVLMLAVVAFAPRNTVTADVASGSDQVTIAARTR